MPEEERLELVSAVEDEFTEDLERLEQSLEDVDDQIRDTGRGLNSVRIDVDTRGIETSTAKIEAFDAAMEDVDDDIDVTGMGDADDVLKDLDDTDDVLTDIDGTDDIGDGGGDRDRDPLEELGDADDVLTDMGDGGDISEIDASRVDVDAAHADVDAGAGFGGGQTALTSGGERDFTLGSNEGQRDLFGVSVPDLDADMEGFDADFNRRGIRRTAGELAENLGDMRYTMGSFHQTVAALIPLLGVFVGAIPAAIVGVGALGAAALGAAGALGGIAALGAVGMNLEESGEVGFGEIRDRLGEAADTFVDAFAPLAEQFAPVLRSAITELEMMAGPLADASAGLLQFRDEFGGFVDFVTGGLPSFTRGLLTFTHAAMPLLSSLGETIAEVDWFGAFADQLSRALPALTVMGGALTEIIPAVISLSQGFLVVASALTGVLGAISWLLNLSPMLTKALGVIIGSFLVLISVTTLYTLSTRGLIYDSLELAATLVGKVATALNAHIANMLGVAASSWAAYAATAALLGVLTLGLAPALGALSTQFGSMGSNIKGARKELDKFASTQEGLRGPGGLGQQSPAGNAANAYQDNSTTIINAGSRDDAARQQYSSEFERRRHVDAVFSN